MPLSATVGTIISETKLAALADGSSNMLYSLNDDSSANEVFMYQHSSNATYVFRIYDGSATQTVVETVEAATTNPQKNAFGWEVNNMRGATSGTLATLDISGTIPTGLTTFDIGSDFNSSALITGHIYSITYVPRRMSDAELVEKTT
jgi:hypothetical protein